MFSPAGEEFCIEENIAKDSSCKVGDSGARMEIKVWISKVLFHIRLLWFIQIEKDSCLLNVVTVQDSDFGQWQCLGNHWDNWADGTVTNRQNRERKFLEICE